MPSGRPVVYLDHAATTPLRPEALEAMLPFLAEHHGNASGMHSIARTAKTALEEAREITAAALGCQPAEIVFTGGGTEADNLAVKGAALAARLGGNGDGVVVTAFEHHAVLHSGTRLERDGFRLREVSVTPDGVIDLAALAEALDERTVVVSTMLVNNEVGTVAPLAEIAALVRERSPRAVLHTDSVQAMAWADVARDAAVADLVAISAHKVGGPKGVGVLVVRRGTQLQAVIDGGGQERNLRSGTVNVAGIVGMAAALRVVVERRADDVARIGGLRDRLRDGLISAIPDARPTAAGAPMVAGTCHLTFPKVEAESLLLLLDRDGVCASAGSSCQSGSMDPSHVLLAMGFPKEAALSAIRLSLGWSTTDADVDRALEAIPAAVAQLRDGSRARSASRTRERARAGRGAPRSPGRGPS